MSANGIAHLSTKEAKQHAKLALAELKRQGYTLNRDGSVASGPDTTKDFYRTRNYYDITELPTQYNGNALTDNPNVGGLILGRPWIVAPATSNDGIIMETGEWIVEEDGTTILQTE